MNDPRRMAKFQRRGYLNEKDFLMQYVFNPKNRQINPVTAMTFVDSTLRDKVISKELYALVCKGKVSVEDVAALFAVGKSPEILLKNHAVVKDNPITKAPAATATVTEEKEALTSDAGGDDGADGPATADAAFDKRTLWRKTQADLLILAGTVGIDVNAEGFAPTQKNLIAAILERAEAAEAGKPSTPATPEAPATV